jgi:hypothetical protein
MSSTRRNLCYLSPKILEKCFKFFFFFCKFYREILQTDKLFLGTFDEI